MSSAPSDTSSVTSADTVLSRPPLYGARPGLPLTGSSARAQEGFLSFDDASDSLSVFSFATGDGDRSSVSYQDNWSRDYSYVGPSANVSAPSRFWEVASLAAGAAVVLAGTATIISRSRDRGRASRTGAGPGSAGAERSDSAQDHARARYCLRTLAWAVLVLLASVSPLLPALGLCAPSASVRPCFQGLMGACAVLPLRSCTQGRSVPGGGAGRGSCTSRGGARPGLH